MHVLKSLAEVKSIVLLTDLPQSDNLVTQVFTRFFDVISGSSKASSGEQLAKTVGVNMTAILAILTDESAALPQEAVDTIVAQFLRVDPKVVPIPGKGTKVDDKQSTLVMKELPPAYNMAKTICSSCPEKMAAEISKYFSDVILDASTAAQRKQSGDVEDPDDSLLGPSEEDLQELRKAHRLLRELWRACPAVLQNVIPQLEAELSTENIQLRLLATETLGDIVSGIGAAGSPPPPSEDPATWPPIDLSAHVEKSTTANLLTTPSSPQSFPQHYIQTYSVFLSRRQDKSALVRAAWTTAIGRILGTNGGGIGLSPEEESRLVDDLARMLND
jgi:sister-chromatid-cohesion protein PDS5